MADDVVQGLAAAVRASCQWHSVVQVEGVCERMETSAARGRCWCYSCLAAQLVTRWVHRKAARARTEFIVPGIAFGKFARREDERVPWAGRIWTWVWEMMCETVETEGLRRCFLRDVVFGDVKDGWDAVIRLLEGLSADPREELMPFVGLAYADVRSAICTLRSGEVRAVPPCAPPELG